MLLCSPRRYILVGKSKLVSSLRTKFPIPVETYPDSVHYVQGALVALGATEVQLRLARAKDGPVIGGWIEPLSPPIQVSFHRRRGSVIPLILTGTGVSSKNTWST